MADIYCCHFEYGGTSSSTYGLHFVNVNTERFINVQGQVSGVNILNKRNKRNYLIDDEYSDFPVSYDIDIVTDDERTLTQEECRAIENWLFNRKYNMKLYIDPEDDYEMYTYDKYLIVGSYPTTGEPGVTYLKASNNVFETKIWNGSEYVQGNNMRLSATSGVYDVLETIDSSTTKYYRYDRPNLNTLYVHRLYLNCRFLNPEKLEYNGGIVGYKAMLVADSGLWLQDPERVTYSLTGSSNSVALQIGTDHDVYTYPKVSLTSSGAAYSGVSSNTLKFLATPASPNKKYRCIVTDGNGNTRTSDTYTVAVHTGDTPYIVSSTSAPENNPFVAKYGQVVTFSVRAVGEDLTYQWQRQQITQDEDLDPWTDCYLPLNDTADFTFTMIEEYDNRRYRCHVNGYGTLNGVTGYHDLYTNDTTDLYLEFDDTTPQDGSPNGTFPVINKQPKSIEVFDGERASFSIDAANGRESGLTYQWQVSKDNGTNWKNCVSAGNTNSIFGFTAKVGYSGWKYRCVVSNVVENNIQYAYSNAVTLTVNDGSTPIVTTLPNRSLTVLNGSEVSLPVTAYGTDLTYKWQVSTNNGSSWSDCETGDIEITNYTDDQTRPTGLVDVPSGTTIVLNGETNYVSNGYFSKFNTRHFPRILPFVSNTFTVTGPLSSITFEYVNRRNL